MNNRRLVCAADAASYAKRLQHELARIATALNTYRGSPGLELLRDRSYLIQSQLEAIARRLSVPDGSAESGRYPLSEAEHLALETASDLRERMTESLARYRRAAQIDTNRTSE